MICGRIFVSVYLILPSMLVLRDRNTHMLIWSCILTCLKRADFDVVSWETQGFQLTIFTGKRHLFQVHMFMCVQCFVRVRLGVPSLSFLSFPASLWYVYHLLCLSLCVRNTSGKQANHPLTLSDLNELSPTQTHWPSQEMWGAAARAQITCCNWNVAIPNSTTLLLCFI